MIPLFRPKGRYHQPFSGDVLVLSPGDIPTVDFYVRSRIPSAMEGRVRYVDSQADDFASEKVKPGSFVVIVRHAGQICLEWLMLHRDSWSGVAFLMDDDIPGAWFCLDVPRDYGLWTTGRYLLALRKLATVCDRIWVSTPVLAQRYSDSLPLMVAPQMTERQFVAASMTCRRWGYHGTRIHQGELRWLVPLVKAVHDRLPDVEFEVFGAASIARQFSGIPRVKVVAPLPWAGYKAYSIKNRLAIAVAPLLPGRFNHARSHVKIFDMARSGATGIFSREAPYAGLLADAGVTLLPNDRELWMAEVIQLFNDPGSRLSKFAMMSEWLEERAGADTIESLIA